MALARSEGTSQRFYSLSSALRVERAAYYAMLEATQKGNLDITERLAWFLSVLDQALATAETVLAATLRKHNVWAKANALSLNARQALLLNRLLDGFVGKLTSSKWAAIAHVRRTQPCATSTISSAPGSSAAMSLALQHELQLGRLSLHAGSVSV